MVAYSNVKRGAGYHRAGSSGGWGLVAAHATVSLFGCGTEAEPSDLFFSVLALAVYPSSDPDPALDRALLALPIPCGLLLESSAQEGTNGRNERCEMVKKRVRQLFQGKVQELPVLVEMQDWADQDPEEPFVRSAVYPAGKEALDEVAHGLRISGQVHRSPSTQSNGDVVFYSLRPRGGCLWDKHMGGPVEGPVDHAELFFFDALIVDKDEASVLGKRKATSSDAAA